MFEHAFRKHKSDIGVSLLRPKFELLSTIERCNPTIFVCHLFYVIM